MEEINIHNYEVFLLDYSEGVLTEEQICNLELFAMLNPNLGIDLNELNFVKMFDDEIYFQEKTHLKKTDSDLISENQFIGYIEKQLSELEMIHVEKSCALNISLAKEFNLYKSTCLVADETILYPTPNNLKRRSKVIWYNFSATSFAAAASIVILLGLFFVWRNFNSDFKLKEVIALTEFNKIKNNKESMLPKNNNTSFLVEQKKSNIKENKLKTAINGLNKKIINKNLNKTLSVDLMVDTQKVEIIPGSQNPDYIANKNIQDVSNPNTEKIKTESVVTIISENESNETVSNKNKKGAWAIACKALKKLNKLGVKRVNGNESVSAGYALNFGELSLKHKSATTN